MSWPVACKLDRRGRGMKIVVRRNRYTIDERKRFDFNLIRTPAGLLQAIPLATGRVWAHVESDTPLWQSVTARKVYAIVGVLLAPLALAAFAFAAWALTAQMNWTADFLFTDGPLAHWIVWAGMGLAIAYCSSALSRAGARLSTDRLE